MFVDVLRHPPTNDDAGIIIIIITMFINRMNMAKKMDNIGVQHKKNEKIIEEWCRSTECLGTSQTIHAAMLKDIAAAQIASSNSLRAITWELVQKETL